MNREGIKHLLECKCILPQFKNVSPIVFHKFVVFSIIDEDGSIIPSYAQCNNCGVIHKILEVGQSEILKKEASAAIQTADDIKLSLPEKLIGVLEASDCDLSIYQEVQFILENKKWGRGVVLSREKNGDNVEGKFLLILGESLFKIESFLREDGLI